VHGVVIRGNRIHGCGKVADGSHDHAIYVANADGAVVSDNVIEDVYGGWGIHLWTTSINGVFERNVIRASPAATQGGVVIVAGSSTGNAFRYNTLVSTGKPYVVDDYGSQNGAVFASNCVVAQGAPVFADASFDGGGNRTVASESDCGGSNPTPDLDPNPTPDPPPPPSVDITGPTGDVAQDWVCPTANASGGTSSVRFTLDGSRSYTATQAPWQSTCWDLQPGAHTLQAEASTGATDSVTFRADPPQASVKITDPSGDLARDWVCPKADASAGTTSVRFTLDGTSSYTATQSPWVSTCWGLEAGEHTLKAEASTGATDTVTFTAGPWVKITDPTGDIPSDSICPRADASDGTDSVRFTLDGTYSYTAQDPPWQSTCWGELAPGQHTLVAETPSGATDRLTFSRR
jgi:rubredoxin